MLHVCCTDTLSNKKGGDEAIRDLCWDDCSTHNCKYTHTHFTIPFISLISQSTKRLMSESDVGTPVELPPAVSLQAPLEESATLAKKMVHPLEPSSAKAEGDTKSAEAQVHMEESSWLGDAVETTTTAISSFAAPQMVTAVVSSLSLPYLTDSTRVLIGFRKLLMRGTEHM